MTATTVRPAALAAVTSTKGMANTDYQAGSCNIGGRERSQRRLLGYASLAGTAVLVAAVLGLALPEWYLLGAFPLLFGGTLGVLQARERFCVGYGLAGRYGFDDAGGTIEDEQAKASDRKRALSLSAKALVVAAVGTAVVYGLGVSV